MSHPYFIGLEIKHVNIYMFMFTLGKDCDIINIDRELL